MKFEKQCVVCSVRSGDVGARSRAETGVIQVTDVGAIRITSADGPTSVVLPPSERRRLALALLETL